MCKTDTRGIGNRQNIFGRLPTKLLFSVNWYVFFFFWERFIGKGAGRMFHQSDETHIFLLLTLPAWLTISWSTNGAYSSSYILYDSSSILGLFGIWRVSVPCAFVSVTFYCSLLSSLSGEIMESRTWFGMRVSGAGTYISTSDHVTRWNNCNCKRQSWIILKYIRLITEDFFSGENYAIWY